MFQSGTHWSLWSQSRFVSLTWLNTNQLLSPDYHEWFRFWNIIKICGLSRISLFKTNMKCDAKWVKLAVYQSINQSMIHSTNHPINQSINQWFTRPINQSIVFFTKTLSLSCSRSRKKQARRGRRGEAAESDERKTTKKVKVCFFRILLWFLVVEYLGGVL